MISALTIGVPSFFLALEPNYERVSGKFLPTVLGRALPGGLTNLLLVIVAQGIMTYLGLPPAQISTTCTAIIAVVGMLVLRKTCQPFHLFRHVLWWAMALALVFCFTVLSGFFELTPGTGMTTWVMVGMLAAAPLVFWGIQVVLKAIGKRSGK